MLSNVLQLTDEHDAIHAALRDEPVFSPPPPRVEAEAVDPNLTLTLTLTLTRPTRSSA